MHRTALRAIAPLALMALIFYLSAQPSVGPELPAFTRVIAHFTEYAVLAALWAWALIPALGSRGLWAAAAITGLYAITDEFHQSFIDGRDSDPLDVLTDWAGMATALLVIRARRERARRPRASSAPR
jgi:VanZ family protein